MVSTRYMSNGIACVNPLIPSVWEAKLWKVKRKLLRFIDWIAKNNEFGIIQLGVRQEPCAVQQAILLSSLSNYFCQYVRYLKNPVLKILWFRQRCEQQLWHVQFNILPFLLQSFFWSSFIEESHSKLLGKEKRYLGWSFWTQSSPIRWRTEQDVSRW